MNPTIGKIRRLQQCSTPQGKFVMFALDHRGNLRHSLRPEAPDTVTYEQMVSFKQELITEISAKATAVLLDPVYGVGPAIVSGAIAPESGLIVAVEKTGYTGDPTARESQILDGWSVEKIVRLGASGVKLLLYYHPDARQCGRTRSACAAGGAGVPVIRYTTLPRTAILFARSRSGKTGFRGKTPGGG